MPSDKSFSEFFSSLPKLLLGKLEKNYTEIKVNFAQRRFEPSELNGGKFCEVVLRILQWHTSVTGSYTPFGTKIRDFGQATRSFESLSAFPDSVRFHVPRILNALFTIRNKHGVGHVGGDVDPNHMDALFVVAAADWVMAELLRIFHDVSTEEAQDMVEALISKRLSVIWEVGGRKRVLDPNIRYLDRTLLLLYDSYPKVLLDRTLYDWTEHTNLGVYRNRVLKRLHREKFAEYDVSTGEVHLSPTGLQYVEQQIKTHI